MDALEIIKADHRRILSLFDQLKAESGVQQIKLLMQNLRHDFGLLFYAKENVIYPAFKNYPHISGVTKNSIEQQKELTDSLNGVVKMQENSLDFQNCLLELKNHFESYVACDEEEFFPLVRQEMKRPDRERLGRHYQTIKQEREESAA